MPKTDQIIERLHNKIIKCASACRWRISYVIVWHNDRVMVMACIFSHYFLFFSFFLFKNKNVLPLFSFFDSHSDSVALSHFVAVEALFPFGSRPRDGNMQNVVPRFHDNKSTGYHFICVMPVYGARHIRTNQSTPWIHKIFANTNRTTTHRCRNGFFPLSSQ